MSKSKKQSRVNSTTELVNERFFENQKRQALCTDTTDTDEPASASVDCDVGESTALKSVDLLDLEYGEDSSSNSGISLQVDKSRKGSVDERILILVNLINAQKNTFFTTSSCSGRIILYTWNTSGEEDGVNGKVKGLKQGCNWLLVSHDEVQPEEVANKYLTRDGYPSDVYFKMEPAILHVQCRTLTDARKLIHISTESGFRNSGMVIGKENRMTVAIRSAIGLEVPLPSRNERICDELVKPEYLKYLVETANTKMRENWNRIEKLTNMFSKEFTICT